MKILNKITENGVLMEILTFVILGIGVKLNGDFFMYIGGVGVILVTTFNFNTYIEFRNNLAIDEYLGNQGKRKTEFNLPGRDMQKYNKHIDGLNEKQKLIMNILSFEFGREIGDNRLETEYSSTISALTGLRREEIEKELEELGEIKNLVARRRIYLGGGMVKVEGWKAYKEYKEFWH